MHIKAVLLDLDNTLYEYERCNSAALDSVISRLSSLYNKPKETVMGVFETARRTVKLQLNNTGSSHSRFLYFQKMIEALKGYTDIKLTQEIHDLYWETYLNQMRLYEGVVDFLEYLKKSKIRTAIISNLTVEIQFKKLTRLGIDKYIDFVITSEEAGRDKPDESIFRIALNKLQLPKDEVVMIGDEHESDILGAEKFGIRYIPMNNGDFRSVAESFKALNSL